MNCSRKNSILYGILFSVLVLLCMTVLSGAVGLQAGAPSTDIIADAAGVTVASIDLQETEEAEEVRKAYEERYNQ